MGHSSAPHDSGNSAAHHDLPRDLKAEDSAADVKGILILFGTLVLMAIYFVSGWAPGI
jgi:hypothetical protein